MQQSHKDIALQTKLKRKDLVSSGFLSCEFFMWRIYSKYFCYYVQDLDSS